MRKDQLIEKSGDRRLDGAECGCWRKAHADRVPEHCRRVIRRRRPGGGDLAGVESRFADAGRVRLGARLPQQHENGHQRDHSAIPRTRASRYRAAVQPRRTTHRARPRRLRSHARGHVPLLGRHDPVSKRKTLLGMLHYESVLIGVLWLDTTGRSWDPRCPARGLSAATMLPHTFIILSASHPYPR